MPTPLNDDDLTVMQALASRTWHRGARHHAGQLAWSARHREAAGEAAVRTWSEDGEVVAWAWMEEPGWLELCVDPTHRFVTDLARDAVSWFVGQAPSDRPSGAMVLEAEHHLLDVLKEAGFVDEGGPWFTHHHLDLAELPDVPEVPGYRLRAVTADDAAPRAACHRAAWSAVPRAALEGHHGGLLGAHADGALPAVSRLGGGRGRRGLGGLVLDLARPDHGRRADRTGRLRAGAPSSRARECGEPCCTPCGAPDAAATEALVCPRGDQGYPAPGALYRQLGFVPGERTVTLNRYS